MGLVKCLGPKHNFYSVEYIYLTVSSCRISQASPEFTERQVFLEKICHHGLSIGQRYMYFWSLFVFFLFFLPLYFCLYLRSFILSFIFFLYFFLSFCLSFFHSFLLLQPTVPKGSSMQESFISK